MSGFNISLKGLDATLSKLKKTGGDVAKDVDMEIAANVELMAKSAKRLAPVDTGRLRNSISASRISFLQWELVAQTDYAAYVEFGTGTFVDVPRGLESYAIQFKGKGIKQVNMPASPYLFPSLFAYRSELIKDIKRVLSEKR